MDWVGRREAGHQRAVIQIHITLTCGVLGGCNSAATVAEGGLVSREGTMA